MSFVVTKFRWEMRKCTKTFHLFRQNDTCRPCFFISIVDANDILSRPRHVVLFCWHILNFMFNFHVKLKSFSGSKWRRHAIECHGKGRSSWTKSFQILLIIIIYVLNRAKFIAKLGETFDKSIGNVDCDVAVYRDGKLVYCHPVFWMPQWTVVMVPAMTAAAMTPSTRVTATALS